MTTEQHIPAPQGTTKQTDPFWYRRNYQATLGCTATPSNTNPNLTIEDIIIKPGSQEQLKHKILASGILKGGIGSVAFHIKLSASNAPFIQTISTDTGKVDDKGAKVYFNHINLKAPVKAQILRLFEALQQPGFQLQAQSYAQPQVPVNPFAQMPTSFQGMNPFQGGINYNQYAQPQVAQPPVYPDYSGYAMNQVDIPTMPSISENDLPV